ncbi:MAG: phosphodiester glycosidase family protein [bacterium]
MQYSHRSLSLIAALLIILMLGNCAWAKGTEVIYKETKVEPVAPGVTYETTWQFTPAGWLRVFVLRADLGTSTVSTDLLLPEKGLSVTQRLSEMAAGAGAVAAINGDFFFGAGFGTPLGPVVTSGELLSSPSLRKDLAVFGLRSDQGALVGNFSFEGQLKSDNGSSFPLVGWNKPGDSYNQLYGFDGRWGETTPASVPEGSLAAIIRNNIVVELVSAANGITIPPKSGVLIGAGEAAEFLLLHLTPGSQVEIDISTTPSWQEFAWVLGGGTVLIKDGQIVPFTHEVKGNSPRSAVGISSDGRQLILAAVDGRQEESRGLTQAEWAAMLLDLGAYQALNLDGGGSTTVLARLPGEENASIVNKPSDIKERPVGNGIAIFSQAPQEKLAGLTISVADTNIVPQGSRMLTVKGFDANYNPVAVDADSISWQVEPAGLGFVEGNVFTAGTSSGKGKVIATCNSVQAELAIEVIGSIVRLQLAPERLVLDPNEEATFTAYGYDSIGQRALICAEDLNWRALGEVGTALDGKIKAGPTAKAGAVEAKWGEVAARALVTVGTHEIPLLYFEAMVGISSAAFPTEVKGSVALTELPEPVYDREHSLRLDYDFTSGSGTKAAYVVFDQGLALPGEADKLSLMVHGNGQGHWLRALLVDNDGQEFTVDFARQVDWTGWKQVEAKLPAGAYPYVLKRIYIAEPDAAKHNAGTIYFDNLALTSSIPFATDMSLAPKPFPDKQYTTSPVLGELNFFVVAALPEQLDQLTWVEALKEAAETNKAAYVVCLKPLSESAQQAWEQALGIPIKAAAAFERWDEGTTVFYRLDAAGGTLVHGDAIQWQQLQTDLAGLNGQKQVFIFTERQPFAGSDGFSSRPEADLLRRRLTETSKRLGALVWTFSPSANSGFAWDDGVRYQRLQLPVDDEAPRIAFVSLKDGKATYTGLKY